MSESYGVWKVTTEGDCEGRSIRQLGTHKGEIVDIAFYLADKCYYTLEFVRDTKPKDITWEDVKTKYGETIPTKVNIRVVGVVSDNPKVYQKLVGDNYIVKRGNYYKSMHILNGTDPEKIKAEELRQKLIKAGFDLDEVKKYL